MQKKQLAKYIGYTSVSLGIILLWKAVQTQICAGFGGSCAPNITYLIPGTIAVVFGLSTNIYTYFNKNKEPSMQQQTQDS